MALFPKTTNKLATTSKIIIMWAIVFIGYSISARYTAQMTIGVIGFISSTIVGMILQLLSGNSRPSDSLLILLFLVIASIRAVAYLGYYFLSDTSE